MDRRTDLTAPGDTPGTHPFSVELGDAVGEGPVAAVRIHGLGLIAELWGRAAAAEVLEQVRDDIAYVAQLSPREVVTIGTCLALPGVAGNGQLQAIGEVARQPRLWDGQPLFLTVETAALNGSRSLLRWVWEVGSGGVLNATADAATVSRLWQLAASLPEAVANGELEAYFQPKLILHGPSLGKVEGVEALARWTRGGQAVPIGELLDAASFWQEGLFDAAMMQAAFAGGRRLATHPAFESALVYVNLSDRQLLPGLCDTVLQQAEAAGLPPSRIGVEVSEKAKVPDNVLGELQALRGAGVAVSIDDFGAGFSSVDRVRRLPSSEVKIDRSLVSGVGYDTVAAQALGALISHAHVQGRSVVVEGVENASQLRSCQEAGADVAQGFLFSKAEPVDKLLSLSANPFQGPMLSM